MDEEKKVAEFKDEVSEQVGEVSEETIEETLTETDQQETDYKALYEQAKANSRKWERAAKSNRRKTENVKESLESRVNELEGALDALRQERDRTALLMSIAEEKNVPAALIVGDDEEAMRASADALVAFAKSKAPKTPADKGGAASGFVVSEDSIRDMKSPAERVMAYARMRK